MKEREAIKLLPGLQKHKEKMKELEEKPNLNYFEMRDLNEGTSSLRVIEAIARNEYHKTVCNLSLYFFHITLFLRIPYRQEDMNHSNF